MADDPIHQTLADSERQAKERDARADELEKRAAPLEGANRKNLMLEVERLRSEAATFRAQATQIRRDHNL